MQSFNVALVNRSTVLSDSDIQLVLPAFQAQVTEDFAPHWNVTAVLSFVGLDEEVPDGVIPLYVLDHTDVPDAGGYHDDSMGTIYGRVFALDSIEGGQAWTVDASHELLEILGDPTINAMALLPDRKACLREACDPVEADELAYQKLGVTVTDFVLPRYYDDAFNGGQGIAYDFMEHLRAPAPSLLEGGYLGILDLDTGMWGQITMFDALG